MEKGWLKRFLGVGSRKKEVYPLKEEGGLIKLPSVITFDFEANANTNVPIFWAYSKDWTNCKGGSNFELSLSQTRLQYVDNNGIKANDIRFTLPKVEDTAKKYNVRLFLHRDKITCRITPDDNLAICVRLQLLTIMPDKILVGIGLTPGATIWTAYPVVTKFTIT